MLSQIDGVYTYPILTIPDERGMVMKIPHPTFDVRDVYATTVRQFQIKAWHGYETKRIFWTVVKGMVQLALFDNRKNSPTYQTIDTMYIGTESYFSVEVPPGVFNGFRGISQEDAIIVVQASEPYGQIYRLEPYNDMIFYEWSKLHG